MLWQSCAFRKRVRDRQSVRRPVLVTENPTTIRIPLGPLSGGRSIDRASCSLRNAQLCRRASR